MIGEGISSILSPKGLQRPHLGTLLVVAIGLLRFVIARRQREKYGLRERGEGREVKATLSLRRR